MIIKPMLALKTQKLENIEFPVLASPNLNGIRALKINGTLVDKNLQPIKNSFIRTIIESTMPDGVDGEIIINNNLKESSQHVELEETKPNFKFCIFDYVSGDLKKPFSKRLQELQDMISSSSFDGHHFSVVEHKLITSLEELLNYEEKAVSNGYKGIIIRSLSGPYKCGKCSPNERHLIKIKNPRGQTKEEK